MTKDPKATNCTITVLLKTGEKFVDMDVPSEPFGNEGLVAFWVGDGIRFYHWDSIEYIQFNFNDE